MKFTTCRVGTAARTLFLVAALTTGGLAVAADAGGSQEQRVRDLEQRVRDLEAAVADKAEAGAPAQARTSSAPEPDYAAEVRETMELLSAEEMAAKEFPGSWAMSGTNLRIKLGGYFKTDLLYDFDGTTDKYQLLASTIPVEGEPAHADGGYTAFFARETRFNIDVRRNAPGAPPLRAFVEADFWSATGNLFRLRHAYMTVGDFLIGQTWTTLSIVEALPFIIDFGGGDALFGGRTAQIRYQKKVNNWKLFTALEAFDNQGIENPFGLGGQARPRMPLLALRADYRWDKGFFTLGASAGQLRWDGGATGPSDTAMQLDALVAGKVYIGTDNYFSGELTYGKGSGEHIMSFGGSNANAVLDASGRLRAMNAMSMVLGYWHKWNAQWSTNVSYAHGWLDTPAGRAPLSLQNGGIGHANLIWRPVPQFSTGVEFMYGLRKTHDNSEGNASRIQFMAKYDF